MLIFCPDQIVLISTTTLYVARSSVKKNVVVLYVL